MKYGVYTKMVGIIKANIIVKIGTEDMTGWELVAETRTKAEAKKIFNSIGGSFF